MELTQTRLASLLAYCRIDEPEEADIITLGQAYGSAVEYLRNAGVAEPEEAAPRRDAYDLCVNYMVLDLFDQRDAVAPGSAVSENPSFRRLLNQLKFTEPGSAGR